MENNRKEIFSIIAFLILDIALIIVVQKTQHLLWEILLAIALFLTLISLIGIIKNLLKKRKSNPLYIRISVGLLSVLESIALLFGMFYFAQDMLLFYPGHDQKSWEYLAALPEFETVEIPYGKTAWQGVLRRPLKDEPSPLIIFFYGNAQNAASTMRQMENSHIWPYFQNYCCLIIDYAGYGINDGRPSMKNMCEEALAVFDYAHSLPEVSSIIIGGYSLGTGPAIYLAAQREANGLFLLAPYANTYDAYNNTLPIFYGPLRLFVKHKLPADVYAKALDIPSLVVASQDDEIIPYASSERLSECLGENCTLITLNGVGHNSILFNRMVLEGIQSYLKSLE